MNCQDEMYLSQVVIYNLPRTYIFIALHGITSGITGSSHIVVYTCNYIFFICIHVHDVCMHILSSVPSATQTMCHTRHTYLAALLLFFSIHSLHTEP